MPDIADKADEIINKTAEDAIISARKALKPSPVRFCIDCECEIPEARKKALPSAKRCIDCQELKDG